MSPRLINSVRRWSIGRGGSLTAPGFSGGFAWALVGSWMKPTLSPTFGPVGKGGGGGGAAGGGATSGGGSNMGAVAWTGWGSAGGGSGASSGGAGSGSNKAVAVAVPVSGCGAGWASTAGALTILMGSTGVGATVGAAGAGGAARFG